MAKKLTAEQRSARRAEVAERVERATAELLTSEGWQRWVRTRAKFHKYSFNNTIMIAMQCPDATHVAGFRKWLELKRQVRKGEKAITILGPVIVKVENEITKKPEPRCVGFKGVSVFDISQTDGEPLPEPVVEPITGDSHAKYLPKLKAMAKELGYRVVEEGLNGSCGGYCDPARKVICVDRNGCANLKVRVLIHELAHAHGIDYKDFTRDVSEVIVETVTVVVCDALGLDTSGESIPYIAGWGQRGGLKAIKACAERVDEVARSIEKACA